MSNVARAKNALLRRFGGTFDDRGYTATPKENLVGSVELADIVDDFERGDGDELKMKFRAIHSSSALAANTFGIFKRQAEAVSLLGLQGALSVQFERQARIFRGGRAPNLDVWIEHREGVIAIESKFLEYLSPKTPDFSPNYERLAPPRCEACWWQEYESACRAKSGHLDRAQLIKHYFGLNAYRSKNPTTSVQFLYIFWEPLNWAEIEECVLHRAQVALLASAVSGSEIPLRWMTYTDLWEEWSRVPELAEHVQNLRERYAVTI